MAIVYVGRGPVTGPELDRGQLGPSQAANLRANVFSPGPTQHLWAYEFDAWVGRLTGTNANVRYAAYEIGGSVPVTRIGYSAQASVTTLYTDITGGARVFAAIAVNDRGPSTKGLMLFQGQPVALAILALTADISHSMRQSAAIDEDDENFYDRSGIASPPPDPYGSTVGVNNGHMSIWLVCDTNEAPEHAVNRAPSGTITSTTPTFNGDFRDRNGTWGPGNGGGDRGDLLKQYRIQLRQVGTTTLLWNQLYTATAIEQTADQIQRAYGGSTLTRGVQYEWRVEVFDQFGASSGFTDWLAFTPVSLGYVTLDGNPTGSHFDDNTPDFQGRWNHQTPLSTNAVQVRVLDGNTNTVLQTSGTISKTVASSALPGTLFTITWAESGFATLAWGTKYKYQIRGRDTNNVWSDWSDRRQFITNYAPTIPSNLAPANSQILTDLASFKLRARWSDQDDTPVGSGSGTQDLTGVFRITRPNATTVDVTPTYNSATGDFEFTPTATEFSAFGTYSFAAVGFDGVLYSGEATSLGAASFSAPATLQYLDGPDVTIDTPTDPATVTAATLLVEWTPSEQAQYRVVLHTDGTADFHFDTGWVVNDAARSYVIAAGSYENETAYDLLVGVKDDGGIEGWSGVVNLSVSYAPPPSLLNPQAEPYRVNERDPWPTAIKPRWDVSEEPNWSKYVIKRLADGGPDAAEITLVQIDSQSIGEFVDYFPASGYLYTYRLYQAILVDDVELLSDPVEVSASIALREVVLVSTTDPEAYRTVLATGKGLEFQRKIDEAVYQSPAREAPTTVRRRTYFWEIPITAQLFTNRWADAATRRQELKDLDKFGGVVCARDMDGEKLFTKMADLAIKTELAGNTDLYTATLRLRQEHDREGVTP